MHKVCEAGKILSNIVTPTLFGIAFSTMIVGTILQEIGCKPCPPKPPCN